MTPNWKVDESKILSKSEVATVLGDLHRKAKRSKHTRMTLVVFRLATCCGLRVSEICGLKMRDIRLGIDKPYIEIPKGIAKGGQSRKVPIWRLGTDSPTVRDLEAWKAERESHGAKRKDLFVCSLSPCGKKGAAGQMLDRRNARSRFISACGILGKERQAIVTIHHGRHTCASHLLAAGAPLPVVRDWLGHANISTTSVYSHVVVGDDTPAIGAFDS